MMVGTLISVTVGGYHCPSVRYSDTVGFVEYVSGFVSAVPSMDTKHRGDSGMF